MVSAKSLDELVDKKFTRVYHDKCDQAIVFRSPTVTYSLRHEQDCCEDVYMESIVGDLSCLENTPILVAEEVKSQDKTPQNIDGTTEIVRWFGTSNGYYSESVDLVKLNEDEI